MRRETRLLPLAALTLAAGSAAALGVARRAEAATYNIGASRTYHSVCALLAAAGVTLGPGDVIEVDAGTYTDACQVTASGSAAMPITLRGAPGGARPLFDATGLNLTGAGSVPRAILQWNGGSYWVVQHLEFAHAQGADGNGAAFRLTAGAHDVTFRDVSIHDCQDGGMSDGAATLAIEDSEIFRNGAGDGQSHNLYLTGESVRLQGNYIHDSVGGQNIKLRVHYIEVLYNRIEHAGNYELDLIQGPLTGAANSHAVLIGNVLVRSASADNNGQTILFGSDSAAETGRHGHLFAINNTFVLANASNRLVRFNNPDPVTRGYFLNNVVHTTAAGAAVAYDDATGARMVGSGNWITTGVTAPPGLSASATGADPGFVSATDFHPTMSSGLIDHGTPGPWYIAATGAMTDGTPPLQPASPLGTTARPSVGALDTGAFEFPTRVAGDAGVDGGGDASVADGGVDGGAMDSSTVEAGGTDSGVPDVRTSGDSSASPDGGTGAENVTASGGCGCRIAGGPREANTRGGVAALGLAGAVAFGARRRRRRAR